MQPCTVLKLCLLVGLLVGLTTGIEVASFNIQTLGDTKMAKPDVVDILQKVRFKDELYVFNIGMHIEKWRSTVTQWSKT